MRTLTIAIAIIDFILVFISFVLLDDGELLRPVILLAGAIALSWISLVEYLDSTC